MTNGNTETTQPYPAHVRHAFCSTCNARERVIVAGRCRVCGHPPAKQTNKAKQTESAQPSTETTGDQS